MLSLVLAAFVLSTPAPTDTVLVLGTAERDLTGDGRPEFLRVVGTGPSSDNLALTFSIESAGRTIFEMPLLPLTRTMGYDAGKRQLSPAEYQARLDEFGDSFFAAEKFVSPAGFVEQLRKGMHGHIERIPEAIARDRRSRVVVDSLVASGHEPAEARLAAHRLVANSLDLTSARQTWDEIQRAGVTIFSFSPGGDIFTALAWSARDQRFYRLLECC